MYTLAASSLQWEWRNYGTMFYRERRTSFKYATRWRLDSKHGLSQLDHQDSESNCHRCPLGNFSPSDSVITLGLRPRAITPSSGSWLPAGRLCQLDPSSRWSNYYLYSATPDCSCFRTSPAYQQWKHFLKRSFTGLFTETSSVCSWSVQFAGTWIKRILCSLSRYRIQE